GGEHVDEPEQLRLERRVAHRPFEGAVGPPAHPVHVGALAAAALGDATGEGLKFRLERRGGHRAMQGSCENGTSPSARGSSGRSTPPPPMMLRWISSVPPRIDIDGLVRNSVCHSQSAVALAMPSGARSAHASAPHDCY